MRAPFSNLPHFLPCTTLQHFFGCYKVLSGRSRYGTPTLAIGMSAMGVIAAAPLDFEAIIELVNILYCFSEVRPTPSYLLCRIRAE